MTGIVWYGYFFDCHLLLRSFLLFKCLIKKYKYNSTICLIRKIYLPYSNVARLSFTVSCTISNVLKLIIVNKFCSWPLSTFKLVVFQKCFKVKLWCLIWDGGSTRFPYFDGQLRMKSIKFTWDVLYDMLQLAK